MSAFIPLQTSEIKYNVFQNRTTCTQTLQVHLYCAEKCSTFNYQTGSEAVCDQLLGSYTARSERCTTKGDYWFSEVC